MSIPRQLDGGDVNRLNGQLWGKPGFGQQFATKPEEYGFFGGRGILGDGPKQSAPHQTSTLNQLQALDVQRSEKILNVEVASKLAGYEDPIKLIFPPVIQTEAVVYIRRQYVVGGIATEVPERAPAPVSAVQEDVREVRLRRFGGDVDFNINACLKPDMFQKVTQTLTLILNANPTLSFTLTLILTLTLTLPLTLTLGNGHEGCSPARGAAVRA